MSYRIIIEGVETQKGAEESAAELLKGYPLHASVNRKLLTARVVEETPAPDTSAQPVDDLSAPAATPKG